MSLRHLHTVALSVVLALVSPAAARGNDPQARLTALKEKIEALRREHVATAWPADTPEAIGKLLKHEPGACAGFVRRALRYEPYGGVLRGPRGALAAGGGNSADLALLLHDMLAGAAVRPEMRFAVAELSDQEVKGLLESATKSPPARTATASATAPSPKPPRQAAADRPKPSSVDHSRRQLLADANIAASQIEQALGSAVPNPSDSHRDATKYARTHVWLQVRRGDQWLTLDPAGALALPANAKFMDRLPENWAHTVALRVEVERLEGGKPARETLLETRWPAAELEGRPIELMVFPAELSIPKMIDPAAGPAGNFLEQAKLFKRFAVTVALAGEKPRQGRPFGLDGKVGADQGPAGPTGIVAVDPFKRFGNRAAAPGAAAPAAGELAGVWLTLTVNSPGMATERIERTLLDRIGAEARRQKKLGIAQPWQDSARVAVALLQRHLVVASVGTVGSARAGRQAVEAAVLDQPLLQRAAEVEQNPEALAEALKQITPPSFPSDLLAVNDASLALAGARLMGHGACYVASPNLYLRSETLDLAPDGSIVSRSGIDIARHGLTVLADPKRAWRTRLLHGLAASELEGRVLDGEETKAASAARSLRAAGAGAGFTAVRSAQQLDALPIAPEVKAVMAGEFGDAVTLLVPAKPQAAGSESWWRVTRDGHVIAVGRDGRGQAVTEGGMVLTDVSIPQVKNCMTFVACLNKGVAGGGAMVQTAASCWAEQVKDVAKETLDNALEQMVGDPFSDLFEGDDDDDDPPPEPGTITHLRDAPFQEPDEQSYYELYQQAREELDELKKKLEEAQAAAEDPLGQLPGVSEGQAAADAGAEIGSALGTRVYLLLTMGHDIARFASQPIADPPGGGARQP